MTTRWVHRLVSLSVGRRLFLALVPSLLALALVIGLAYYGRRDRQAPEYVVLGAALLTSVSLVFTWLNTRYVANRIARLAGTAPTGVPSQVLRVTDEFDRIERVVDSLGSALSLSEQERARADAAAAVRLREEATMLAAVVRDTMAQLDEVRLPLHILLDTRFGDLNENQEELLRDARTAADAIDVALRRLGQVADADRDAIVVQRELVQVNDVLRAVLPLARAAAERASAPIDVSLEPGLPRVLADRARLAEAIALLVDEAASNASTATPLSLATVREHGGITVAIAPSSVRAASSIGPHAESVVPPDVPPPDAVHVRVLADRLVTCQGGVVERTGTAFMVRLGQKAPPSELGGR
ncbi:MAG: hypothetical protein U0132_14355 [Gemmatimonadaceae bacterium]